jgi:hypothetical protein
MDKIHGILLLLISNSAIASANDLKLMREELNNVAPTSTHIEF